MYNRVGNGVKGIRQRADREGVEHSAVCQASYSSDTTLPCLVGRSHDETVHSASHGLL